MIVNKKKCTVECNGIVKGIRSKGIDSPSVITVEYKVDENYYTVKESLKLKSEMIKIGFLPIGQRKLPVLGDVSVGAFVVVRYNPSNPNKAYIKGNKGFRNI